MKKILLSLILLCLVSIGLFAFGCPEREMSRSDEKRVEVFMTDFFLKMFSLSEKEYEDIFYKDKVDIWFTNLNDKDEPIYAKFLNYSTVPEDKKFDEIKSPLYQEVFGSGKDAVQFMAMFKNIGKISVNDMAKIEWFSGFDEYVHSFNIPCKNCCSFDQNLILLNEKDIFQLYASAILYVDKTKIEIAFIFFSISSPTVKEYNNNKIYIWK